LSVREEQASAAILCYFTWQADAPIEIRDLRQGRRAVVHEYERAESVAGVVFTRLLPTRRGGTMVSGAVIRILFVGGSPSTGM
jgi:hypothetical protein